MEENSIEEALEKLSTGKKIKMYKLLRTFEKEGIENFVITRKKYVDVILLDYKRVLKENELLRKNIEGWKKYCEEIEEERIEMSNKNCELEFEVEKLQKENEEWKEAYKSEKKMKNEYVKLYQDLLLEENVIPVQKVKDMQKEKEWALQSYDCTKADYKQSQAIGAWNVLRKLLEGRK